MSRKLPSVKPLISFAFRRPNCTPGGGFVPAKDWATAIRLVHTAYGYCGGTYVFDGEHDYDENGLRSLDGDEEKKEEGCE